MTRGAAYKEKAMPRFMTKRRGYGTVLDHLKDEDMNRRSPQAPNTPAAPAPKAAPAAVTVPATRAPAKVAPSAPTAEQAATNPASLTEAEIRSIARGIVDDAMAAARAPAFHDEDRRNRKSYIDDQIAESVGEEAMETRRRNESLSRQEDEGRMVPSSMRERRSTRREREEADQPGNLVAEYLGWLGVAGGDPQRAYPLAKKNGASPDCLRALGESTFAAGGALVPESISSDYIEFLYNISVFLEMGPRRLDVPHGNMTIPKQTGGATVSWSGENSNAGHSELTTGDVNIALKKLITTTAASNEFLNDSGPTGLAIIRSDLAAAAAVEIDSTLLRSLGTANKPKGLRGWVYGGYDTGSGNSFASTGATVAAITTDLNKAERLIEEFKILSKALAFFMSPRTKFGLMSARDGNNNLVWAGEMRQGTLNGHRFGATPNIPNTLRGSSNKSEIYLAAMDQLIVAQDPLGTQIDVVDGAAYYNGSAVVSAFSLDQSVARIKQRIDMVDRQSGTGIVQIYDVTIA